MSKTLFGRLLGVVAAEVIKEMSKSAEQRFREAEEYDRKKARKRERRAENMAKFEQAIRERAEQERRNAQYAREEQELQAAAGGGPFPFEALKDSHVTNAIALVRPYPPHRSKAGRSHVGGLPDLPAQAGWPCDREGCPLHFLAQVDLAELPPGAEQPADLPRQGTLLFFARMDETLDFEGDPVRVMFDPDSTGRPSEPPEHLPPVDDCWRRSFADEGELAPNILPEWPWILAGIQSIPDTSAFGINSRSDERYAEYDEQLLQFRAAEIDRATGLKTIEDDPHWPDLGIFDEQQRGHSFRLRPFEQTGFPWTSRGITLVSRAIRKHMARPEFRELAQSISEWRARVEGDPIAQAVTVEEANAFIKLLNALMEADRRPYTDKEGVERTLYQDGIKRAIEVGVHRLITETGADPQLAAVLPDSLYRCAYPRHAPLTRGGYKVRHGQILGYMPSSQEPLSVRSRTKTLLQLPSDPGLDLIIGDMGEIDFHIEPEALADERWDQITAWYLGG